MLFDMAELRELEEWMRARGVIYARVGDVELELGELPRDYEPEMTLADAIEKYGDDNTLTPDTEDPYLDRDLYGGREVPSLPKLKGGEHAD